MRRNRIRVVLGDLAELATPARSPENSIEGSVISMPSVSAQSVGDGEQPAAAGQIRKTCGVPAYLRVVIGKHRTQASRTMNAEPAQAAADRVG